MGRNVSQTLFLLMSLVVLANSEKAFLNHGSWLFTQLSPPPSDPCADIVYDMIDCASFLSIGGTDSKPDGSCCSGFKSVLNFSPNCICVAIKGAAEMGIALNMTRTSELPGDCGVTTFSIASCGVSASPPNKSPVEPPPVPAPKHSPAPPCRSTSTPPPHKNGPTPTPPSSKPEPPSPKAPVPSPPAKKKTKKTPAPAAAISGSCSLNPITAIRTSVPFICLTGVLFSFLFA